MIFFLYGEDDFSSNEKLKEIRDDFLKKNAQGSALSVLDFDEETEIDLEGAIRAEGLFSSKRLVVVKNIFQGGGSDVLKRAFEILSSREEVFDDKDLTVVFWENGMPNKNLKLFKLLSQRAKSSIFDKKSGAKLSQWAEEKIEKMGGKISYQSLEQLVSFVGDDLWRMNSEIEKLVSYSDGSEIGVEDVENLVNAKINKDIFGAIDALARKNKGEALRLLHNQLDSGDDPFYVLSMYVYQFRNLLKIGSFYFQGLRNHFEIAKLAKLHPFVVQKGMAQLQGFSLSELRRIYQGLEKLDRQSKTGKIDIVLGLDKFVAEIG